MSRREELEKELDVMQKVIDNASPETPESLMDAYRKELASISLELNNLYDDDDPDDR